MKILIMFWVALMVLACSSQGDEQLEQIEYILAYNVLFDEENDDYEIFRMSLDGTGKKNITNLKGVEWTYYAYKDNIYFVSDKDTSKRMYFLHTMGPNGENVRKVSDIRLRDSWFSTRDQGREIIINPHPSVDSTGFLVIDQTGNLVRQIPIDLPYFSDPAFSPDGQYIAFRGGRKTSKFERGFIDEIYLMDADGSNVRQLTSYPEQDSTAEWYNYHAGPPRWHPTEGFISYHSKQNGKYSLYGITPDGQKQWKLTDLTHDEGWHDWSPEGRWLAIELFDTEQTQFHIGLMDWNSKELKVLTDTTYKYQQAPVFVEMKYERQ